MKVLVTGAAGFIGMHVAQRLLGQGHEVVGVDNLNDYYDVRLKNARLALLEASAGFQFRRLDISDSAAVTQLFADENVSHVIHLAAQAGVRYSLEHPHAYAQANLVGFLNILEGCRSSRPVHLIYASSSSVYGGNEKMPFSEDDPVDHPVSLYAATKRANELMAHSYSHLYGIPTTGLRFFTVYGPWGRPDMAYFKFSEAILAGRAIPVFNHGQLERDFTYIDDIVDGILGLMVQPPVSGAMSANGRRSPGHSDAPFRVLNIGNEHPVPLMSFIRTLEAALGRAAVLEFLPMQAGDVLATHASVGRLSDLLGGARPTVSIEAGLARFADWYLDYRARPQT